MEGHFDQDQRVLIDQIIIDALETMTEENTKKYYDYLKEKLYLHQVSQVCDFEHVLKQRMYGRVKWGLLNCPMPKLKKMMADKPKYKRPFFVEVMTRI